VGEVVLVECSVLPLCKLLEYVTLPPSGCTMVFEREVVLPEPEPALPVTFTPPSPPLEALFELLPDALFKPPVTPEPSEAELPELPDALLSVPLAAEGAVPLLMAPPEALLSVPEAPPAELPEASLEDPPAELPEASLEEPPEVPLAEAPLLEAPLLEAPLLEEPLLEAPLLEAPLLEEPPVVRAGMVVVAPLLSVSVSPPRCIK